MTFFIAIVLVALGASLFLVRVAYGHAKAISRLEDLEGETRPVDIEAFRNLIDPVDERFLRDKLSPAEFRRVQRERTLAAAEYVRRIAGNAAILLRLGQAARTNPNPEIAHAAQEIVNRAVVVRLMAMRTLIKLYTESVIPGLALSSEGVFDRYTRLKESTALLTRLQQPAFASRLAAML